MSDIAPELFRLVMLVCPLLCGWLAMEALVYARLRRFWQRLNTRGASREGAPDRAVLAGAGLAGPRLARADQTERGRVEDRLVEDRLVEDRLVEDRLVEDRLVEERLVQERLVEESLSGKGLAESLGWRRFGAWALSVWTGPLVLIGAAVAIHGGASGLEIWEPVRSALTLSICFVVCLLGLDGCGRVLGRRWAVEGREVPEWLSRAAALAGVPCPPLMRWGDSAGPRLVALWGLTPGGSSIWFSQTAWRGMDDAERRALGLHELAHLASFHPLRRAVWLLMSVALAAGALGLVRAGSWGSGAGSALAMLVTAGLTSAVGLWAFAGYARGLELAADRQAVAWLCRLAAGEGELSWLAWQEQVELYLRALGKLTGAERGGWCHPSWPERRRHLLRFGVPNTRSLA